MSHTNLRKTGPITIGSRVMDTISCALIPLSLGAISDCVRHETTNRVILLEGHYQNTLHPALLGISNFEENNFVKFSEMYSNDPKKTSSRKLQGSEQSYLKASIVTSDSI